MNDFIEENKKTILLIIILILATIIISIASIFVSGDSKNPKPEVAMKELGEIYYEDFYYLELMRRYPDNYMAYLEQKSNDGIKLTLADLLAAIPEANLDVYNDKKGNMICDLYDSYIIITPNATFEREDYSIEVVTKCDVEMIFDDESNISDNNENVGGGSEADV